MEILFILLLEPLIALMTAIIPLSLTAFAAFLELSALVLEAVVALIACLLRKQPAKGPVAEAVDRIERIAQGDDGTEVPTGAAPRSASQKRRVRRKRLLRWLAGTMGVMALLLLAALIANGFFFEPLVRWGVGLLEPRMGVTVAFDRVEGSFWSGRFLLTGLTAKRDSHPHSRFDLAVERAALDLSMRDLLGQRLRIESLEVKGLRGDWTQLARAERPQSRRRFRIDRLVLDDLSVNYKNQTFGEEPLRAALRVETLRTGQLRSDWLVLGLLWAEELRGSLDDAGFTIGREPGDKDEYRRLWRLENLPIPLIAAVAGRPFTWFERGRVDMRAHVHLTDGKDGGLDMQWQFAFRDFHARTPPGSSLKDRALGAPLVAFLNRRNDRLNLAFRIETGTGGLRFASSSDLADFARDQLGERSVNALGEWWKKHTGKSAETLPDPEHPDNGTAP